MGLGYGESVMTGSDITLCQYSYYNDSSTVFTCTDRYATSNQLPTLDTVRNTVDVSTNVNIYYDFSSSALKADFVAQYYRPCNTGDSQDNEIIPSSNNMIIWASGSMSSGTASYHGSTLTSRGAQVIYVKPANGSVWLVSISFIGILLMASSLLF